jgi:MFS family permease
VKAWAAAGDKKFEDGEEASMSEVANELPATMDALQVQLSQPDKYYIVENQTARSIEIASQELTGNPAALILAPFGARRISETQYHGFDFRRWEDPGLIVSSLEPPREERKAISAAEFRVYTTAAAILVGIGLLGVSLPGLLAQVGILTGVQVLLRSFFPLFLLLIIAVPLALVAVYLAQRRTWFSQGGRTLALGLIAVSVIAVAAIGPVLIMVSFTTSGVTVTGRMLQMIFVVIAALLPALLYFLYDRQKVSIVSKTFYREIVLLDPAIHTSADAEEKYGHLINEVYGDKSAGYYLANVGLPITLSSVLIALGWLLILLPIVPASPLGPADFFNLVNPPPSALSFGFLGAYFFALNMVFRRYVRSDLTPKAYSHITVRLLITTILVWAVSVLPDPQFKQSPALLIMAFCIGVVPETGIKVIQEFLRKTIGRFSPSLSERDPLTNLDGIDLYDRARLSEEGVENIESLAYNNLIDLLVQTRIPARRLADMVDQAILYLHLRGSVPPASPADRLPEVAPADEPVPALQYLRGYGIRTATDLLYVWQTKAGQDCSDFKKVLQKQSEGFADRINVIVNALEEADWIPQLQYRRAQVNQLQEKPVTDPSEFFMEETGQRDLA